MYNAARLSFGFSVHSRKDGYFELEKIAQRLPIAAKQAFVKHRDNPRCFNKRKAEEIKRLEIRPPSREAFPSCPAARLSVLGPPMAVSSHDRII